MRPRLILAALLVSPLAVLALLPGALAQDKPRPGGELIFLVPSEPPSYDGHREGTFGVVHPLAPHYNTLLRIDPTDRTGTRPVPDLAESWTIAPDGLTYTLRLRQGVRFHDGSVMTSRDVKASYDKIIAPPTGVISMRKGAYQAVEVVEAPDPHTVRFRLKWPEASFLVGLASPYNWIFKADILARDIRWYETNVMGTGPFKFVEHVKGSHWIGKKNPDYWDKGRPYLDGYRAIFINSNSAQVAAIRGERAHVQFRGFAPPDRDALVAALGPKITVQESPWDCLSLVTMNQERKPFDDKRVRRALTLALDRHEAARNLSRIAVVKEVAGIQVPGTPWATPPAELERLAGYGRDIKASRAEARRLLREAGVPDGYAFTFKNRGLPQPYETIAIWLIDQWRQVGLNVRMETIEASAHVSMLRRGDFEVASDAQCSYIVEPDIDLQKYQSVGISDNNYSRYKDPVLDDLYTRQSRAVDSEERRRLLRALEKRLLDEEVHYLYTLQCIDPFDRTGAKVVPDLAESWTVSPDGLTYRLKLRAGVRFHDGSVMTSRDVKASYDKIVFPPPETSSYRKGQYRAVEAVEAPDPQTIRFRLKWPEASFLVTLASPYSWIFKADILAKDVRWYEEDVMGTGPFTFVEHVKGSHWVGKRNPNYWDKGKPYLDGFRAIFISSSSAQVAAIRGERAHIQFRSFSPSERDSLVGALGSRITVQESPWDCAMMVAMNHERKPWDDKRVRRALTLALDRYEGARNLSRIAVVKDVAGIQVPGTQWATPPQELEKLAGYWRDIKASRAEARRLLREAGIPEGFSFVFKNRGIPQPYEPLGIWLIDQWRQIGLSVRQETIEASAYHPMLQRGDFDVAMDFQFSFVVEPDVDIDKFQSIGISDRNFGRYKDPVLDDLFMKQARALDPEERRRWLRAFEKRLLDEEVHYIYTLQWHRIVPHSSKVRGWTITPAHFLNQQLDTVWLAE